MSEEEQERTLHLEHDLKPCSTSSSIWMVIERHKTNKCDSAKYLKELGQSLDDRPTSEKYLETYQRLVVEQPRTHIISLL